MMYLIELMLCAFIATVYSVDQGNKVQDSSWASAACSLQLKDGTHVCGCTVISDQWLLTSGGCAGMYMVDEVQVALGSFDLNNPKEIKNVEQFIYHEDYHYDKYIFPDDIGLIKLDSKVSFNVIPLAQNDGYEWYWRECKMLGWGMLPNADVCTEHDICYQNKVHRGKCDTDSWYQTNCKKTCFEYNPQCSDLKTNTMNEASTTIITNVACTLNYAKDVITKKIACALDMDNNKASASKLDAGGPLFCKRDNAWYQVGIFSYREQYPDPKVSQIFTLVPKYADWINSQTGLRL